MAITSGQDGTQVARVGALMGLMRPWQWVKNAFVLAPLFFSGKLFDAGAVAVAVFATLVFVLLSAAIYVFNDLCDVDADRAHPLKRHRPVAAGLIGYREALLLFAVLLLAAILPAAGARLEPTFYLYAGIYLVISLGYSLGLKHVPILEMLIVAAGYVLRLLAGSSAIGEVPSDWILCVSGLLALLLIAGKRRADFEAEGDGAKTRPVLAAYSRSYLDILLAIAATGTLLGYVLFTVSDYALIRTGDRGLLATAIFVVYGIMRYIQIVLSADATKASPTEAVVRDPATQLAVAGWIACYFLFFYL